MKTKYIFLFFLLTFSAAGLTAQNIQFHFFPSHSLYKDDFEKNYLQVTYEMFKADKWGTTFMFVDFDFNDKKGNLGSVYTRIMRDQNIGKLPIKAHIEYTGGLASWGSIHNSYLLGSSYPVKVGNFHLTAALSYKYNAFDHTSHDVQLGTTWAGNLLNDKLTLCGFANLASENKEKDIKSDEGKKMTFVAGPQIWYNVDSNISFGSKIIINTNIVNTKTYVTPTISAKWTFN